MRLVPLEPFSKAGPGFNREAAEHVYKAVMACPDDESAAVMVRAIVLETMTNDYNRYRDVIDAELAKRADERAAQVKKALVKQYIDKRATGQDVSEIAKAAEYLALISKDRTKQQRSWSAERQRRAASGRFVKEKADFANTYSRSRTPTDPEVFSRVYGVNHPTVHSAAADKKRRGTPMSDYDIARWQQAYKNIASFVGPYADHDNAFVHVNYGRFEDVQPTDRDPAEYLLTHTAPKSAKLSVVGEPSRPQGSPNFAQMGEAFGQPRAGMNAQSLINETGWKNSGFNPDRLANFREAQRNVQDPLQPGARLFNRLSTGSSLLNDTLGPALPPKAKGALMAGQYIGDYGPEAQKVLGPVTQRTAYRYRGVERRPADDLNRAFNVVNANMPNASVPQKLDYVVNGAPNERGRMQTSPVLQYFKDHLPKANLNTLQLASGTVPPSEGVIMDKTGKLVTQAVGYGDDWYLPFNLKNVNRMRGGSYIRTRTFGGPTTEDIYTGLVSGARSITVVSHNGVYTMEFDPNFKGGRRYNDKAARMVKRYGQILDAVQSGQVDLDLLSPARRREIKDQAISEARNPDDPKSVKLEENRLLEAERYRPRLSLQEDAQIKASIVRDAALRVHTRSGAEMNPEEFRQHLVMQQFAKLPEDQRKVAADLERSGFPAMDNWRRTQLANLTTDDQIIDAAGLRDQYEKTKQDRLGEIKQELSPLALNGKGYALAMNALQEQFPYYLKPPVYHPWNEMTGKNDPGYIKPNHLRPAAALAGYYDQTILPGSGGKVTADSVAGGKYNYVSGRRTAEAEGDANGVVGAGSNASVRPVASGQQAANTAAPAAEGARIPAVVRDQVDRDLANDILTKARTLRDQNLHPWLFDPEGQNEDGQRLAAFLNMTPEDVDDALDAGPDAFHERLHKVVQSVRHPRVPIELNERLVEASRRRGAVAPLRDVDPNDPSAMLRHPNDEYKLGAKYQPSPHPRTRSDVLRTYNEDNLIPRAELGDLEDPDFGDKVDKAIDSLNKQFMSFSRGLQHGQVRESDRNELNRRAEGLMRAKHLQRRLNDVARVETTSQPADAVLAPDVQPVSYQVAFLGLDPDPTKWTDEQRRTAQAVLGGQPNAIENQQVIDPNDPTIKHGQARTFGQNT